MWESLGTTVQLSIQGTITNYVAEGKPVINGIPEKGLTVAADTSGITDPDGLVNVSYSYQWIRVDGSTETDISDADDSHQYTPTTADVGKRLKVRVSFTDDDSNSETLTSDESAEVAEPSAYVVNNLAEAYAGNIAVGQSISSVAQSFTTGGLISVVSMRLPVSVGNATSARVSIYSDSSGAPGSSLYVLTNTSAIDGDAATTEEFEATRAAILQANKTYWVVIERASGSGQVGVSYTNSPNEQGETGWSIGDTYSQRSGSTWSPFSGTAALRMGILKRTSHPATGKPVITGVLETGLTASVYTSDITDENGLTGVSYSYQWVRVDGTDETDILGTDDRRYTLTAVDVGKRLKVKVSFTDDAGFSEMLTSDASTEVAAAADYIISNLSETSDGNVPVQGRTNGVAQSFTTGEAILLTAVRLYLSVPQFRGIWRRSFIRTDNSGTPGTFVEHSAPFVGYRQSR